MATPAVTLYLLPGASSLFPHILLRYCHIPFTPHVIHHPSNLATDLADISAKHQVPVLVLDGGNDNNTRTVVTENPAIAHAINQLAPQCHLFGRTRTDFLKVCEWLNFISGPLHAQAWGPYIRPERFTTATTPEALTGVKAAAEQRLHERFAMLEKGLHADGPWALGEHFTAVDAYVFPFFRLPTARGMMGRGDMEGCYPRWGRVVRGVEGMEAVRETLAFEEASKQ
ncbi:hypothetical protein LTR36_001131 [Oleoguttula mirabilis]|uniref:GST C-terminal domain-containing protein n=1 Tax=Oleoguttula mirabilis TaxID=1507867 RepID=A0AAV9JR64_9PEZI|nr:hypothetical protein LTR36_001131 [Oleoguttula mirabilis]